MLERRIQAPGVGTHRQCQLGQAQGFIELRQQQAARGMKQNHIERRGRSIARGIVAGIRLPGFLRVAFQMHA